MNHCKTIPSFRLQMQGLRCMVKRYCVYRASIPTAMRFPVQELKLQGRMRMKCVTYSAITSINIGMPTQTVLILTTISTQALRCSKNLNEHRELQDRLPEGMAGKSPKVRLKRRL